VQEYQRIQGDVVMFSGVLGDASVDALIPIIDPEDGVIVSSSQSARFRTEPGVAPTFTSYETNVLNAVSWLMEEGEISEDSAFCSLVQEDASGEARTSGLEAAAEHYGGSVAEVQNFAPTDTALTAQVQALKAAGCDVVVWGGTPAQTPTLVAAATQLDFAPTFIGEFYALAPTFAETPIAPYLTDHWIFTGPAGNLDDTSIEGIKVLTEQLGDTEVTMQHVYGFMQGITTNAILEQAIADGDLSGAGLRKAMEEIESISYMGLGGDVTYGPPADRELPRTTSIFRYNVDSQWSLDAAAVQYENPDGVNPDE
jgi:ABC-type branched-subunit amino acid transport system substrate-binding protein